MMTIPEKFIVLILALWLFATILYTVFNRRLAFYTRRFDLFNWLTSYQLFSGTERNFQLSYRDKLSDNDTSDDDTTDWRLISLTVDWKWYHAIWFPQGLVINNIGSVVDDLVRYVEAKKGTVAMKGISGRFIYQTILRFVQELPGNANFAERQFKIEETKEAGGEQGILEVFISDFHKL